MLMHIVPHARVAIYFNYFSFLSVNAEATRCLDSNWHHGPSTFETRTYSARPFPRPLVVVMDDNAALSMG